MRPLLLGPLAACSLACSAVAPPAASPRAEKPLPTTATAVAPPVAAAETSPKELPEAAQLFESARVTGTIAVFDSRDGSLGCSDVARCRARATPASTFKIPHTMIALETGVAEGPDTILPWDKQHYWNESWNQDLSLRDAFRFSCLPCYRALARQVGEAGEREWVHKLGYGNQDISGVADRFWIDGGLLISPLEQLDFLRRFDEGKLPISERTADLVRDIMTLDVTENYVLRGKTGTTLPPEEARLLAWFVGWLEAGERRVFFATLIDGSAPGVDPLQVRRPLTESVLRAKGLM